MKQRVIHLPLKHLKTSVRQALLELSRLELFDIQETNHLEPTFGDVVLDEQGVALISHSGLPLRSSVDSFLLALAHQPKKAIDSSFARALKLHQQKDHLIWDMSVGLAHDTALMRHYGAKRVVGFERHPSIFAMLSCDVHFLGLGVELFLKPDDLMERPEVIYFDPMFPQKKKKSAKSKIGMEIFKTIVGNDEDASEVLVKLRDWAHTRVVVKRAPHAPVLSKTVSFSYDSKTVRYDVYERARPQVPDHR